MKSLGRIFELGNNGNKPFKNKYVIVYENKTYFVCTIDKRSKQNK